MKRILFALAVIGALALPAAAKETLYQKAGGYDGLAAVTDAFLAKLKADPGLGRFFVGHSASSGQRTRQHIVEFLCEKSGGPCFYTGRDMKVAHTGLKITEKDWNDAAALFVVTLNDLNVPKPLQDEVVAFVMTLKPDIVGQ